MGGGHRTPAEDHGSAGCGRIIRRLRLPSGTAMEAEALNQIANSLAGLKERSAAMRRYL